jgi:hypothetical protein
MLINTENIGSSGTPPGRLDRRQAEARQGRWMLELERGLADSREAKGRGAGHVNGAPDGTADANSAEPCSQETGKGRSDWSAGARRGPDRAQGDAAPLAALSWQTQRAGLFNDAATGGQAMNVRLATPSVANLATGSTQQGRSANVDVDAPAGLSLLASCTGHDQRDGLAASSSVGGEPASGASRDAHFGEKPIFGRHLMRLYMGQDGVHAFIRDATLGTVQANRVALAVVSEVKAAGRTVAAVSINGRAVILRGRASVHAAPQDELASTSQSDSLVTEGNSL